MENFDDKVFHVEDISDSDVVELHVCMIEGEDHEGMDNYMETCSADFSIINITPYKELALQYNFPIMGDSTYTFPSLNVHSPTYNFHNNFFSQYIIGCSITNKL